MIIEKTDIKIEGPSMTLDDLIEWKNQGNKIAIFCAGNFGVGLYKIFKCFEIRVDCFFDNDCEKHQKKIIDDCYCLDPCEVKDNKYNYMVFIGIHDQHYSLIKKDVKDKGFEIIGDFIEIIDDIIVNHSEWYMKLLLWVQDHSLPGMFCVRTSNRTYSMKKCESILNKKIAVYTGIFGQYDNLYMPKVKPPNIDYYIIADEKLEDPGSYHWIPSQSIIPSEITSPIKKNRYIKMHPHLIFPQYAYSIYVDGNIQIKGDVSSFIKNCKSGISVFMHPNRDCIFYEALTVVNYHRVVADDVCRQMKKYLDQDMPIHYGMTEMALIAREHHNPTCIKVMQDWWQEFNNGALRDQLSFMYVLWKNHLTMDDIAVLGNDYRKSGFLDSAMHEKESYDICNRN